MMHVGQQIREYTLKRKLGEGGMGEVWLASHGLLEQEVAIKFLEPVIARMTDVRERFIQEAKIQASLVHPGIVRVLNAIEDQGILALVMEYVDGLSLDRVIERRGPLPIEDALLIIKQVLEAVGYAHLRGVVHRDLKPGNIVVQANGTVKVLDFGIAKILGGTKLTRTGTTMGSAHYMAPEQILGRKDIDHRADIYALGCTFYEMLTGRPPFGHLELPDTDSDFVIKQAHISSPVPDPRNARRDIPERITNALIRAMAKRPEDRPNTCEEFAASIGVLNDGLGEPHQRIKASDVVIKDMNGESKIAVHARESQLIGSEKDGNNTKKIKEFITAGLTGVLITLWFHFFVIDKFVILSFLFASFLSVLITRTTTFGRGLVLGVVSGICSYFTFSFFTSNTNANDENSIGISLIVIGHLFLFVLSIGGSFIATSILKIYYRKRNKSCKEG